MRDVSSLLLVALVVAFAVGALSRVALGLERSPQPADRGLGSKRAPADMTSMASAERTVPRLRLASSQRIHTVKPGESLWEIATDQLGDDAPNAAIAAMVKRLAVRNADRVEDPGGLEIGQRLRLVPGPKPARTVRISRERSAGSSPNRTVDARTASRSKEPGDARRKRAVEEAEHRGVRDKPRTYTVKPGESLWQIAERLFSRDTTTVAGVARRVNRLAAINSGRLTEPDLLRTGQKLRLR